MVTKVNYKINNPYSDLPTIKKEKTLHKGRVYVISSHEKAYTKCGRAGLFFKSLALTLLSVGFALFSSTVRSEWKAVFSGKAIKQCEYPKSPFKINTTALAPTPPLVDESKVKKLQEALDSSKIPLNIVDVPLVTESNHVKQDAIDTYLESIKDNAEKYTLKKKLFDEVDQISFQDLLSGLHSCCDELKQKLGQTPYAVGFVPEKSQSWIASLALSRNMDHMPSSHFVHSSDLMKDLGKVQSSDLPSNVRHFVVFDDAAYSGKQLSHLISDFKEKFQKMAPDEECHLYLVVPFFSSMAEERLKNKLKIEAEEGKTPNVRVHVITTDRKIKAVKDVFSDSEINKLANLEKEQGFGIHSYYNGGIPDKCLSYLEWKVPDDTSVPMAIKTSGFQGGESFMTDFKPPYKKS